MVARPVAKWLAVPALIILIALASVVLLPGQPTHASRGTTTQVSVDSAGVQGGTWSQSAALSADGRYGALSPGASQSGAHSLSDDPTLLSHTVSAGWLYTCGVRTDGTLACWGYKGDGAATPPTSTFTRVSAGRYHACGLRTDGIMLCWGFNANGQATPPFGTFTEVSAGQYHNCGVRTDGSITCWGNNAQGQATPPSGTVVMVKATDPVGGTGFGFSDNIAAPNSFSLDDGDTKTFSNVFTDTYTVIEDDPGVTPGGFALTGLTCTAPPAAPASTWAPGRPR